MLKEIINKRGETIAETIIAISVLTIGIMISSTLMATSLQNMNNSKNRVVAVNIAREGIEAVRNIRDTNWLKFSSQKRVCWNQMPEILGGAPDCIESCSDAIVPFGTTDSPILPGNYIVYKAQGIGGTSSDCNTVQRWRLASPVAPFDNRKLYTVDIDTSKDTDGDENFTNDADIYNHKLESSDTASGNDAMGRQYASLTHFSRVITIDYLDNDGDSIGAGALNSSYNRMSVTSKVTWIRKGREHSVELKTNFTDYFGRDNLGS